MTIAMMMMISIELLILGIILLFVQTANFLCKSDYLCKARLILQRLADGSLPGPERRFDSMGDVLLHLDADLCRKLLQILRELTILDPACGSGAFLVAAMKTL